jgi:DNA repair exonuclease SbcCD nuclease subunit
VKICISADWHINKDNRLEDMERTLAELVQKVIAIKPSYFIFLGDAYRNWRPTPLEMNIFHRAILDIASKGIHVVILVGNHDMPESDEYRGVHCFTELTTLIKNDPEYNINVVDTPSVWTDISPDISAIFIPYLPKSTIEGTYAETFARVLKEQVVQVKTKKMILFSHVFLQEAKVGAGDIDVISASQVSADILRQAGVIVAFLGDIHKAQKIDPCYFYPGSIERIDFNERDDTKGFIIYKPASYPKERLGNNGDEFEFVELNARKLEQVVIDLVSPGFIKEAMVDNKDSIIRDPYSYVIAMLDEKKDQLKNAVIKIKIICTKDQKSKIDIYENKIVAHLLDEIEIHNLKSISYELVDSVSVRNADINESLNPIKAFHMWIDMQDYKGDIGQHIVLAGENILKGHKV